MATSVLALLSAQLPLLATLSSTLIAITPTLEAVVDPTPSQLADAQSLHVFAFSSHGDVILAESEGDFSLEDWERVYGLAETACSTPGSAHIGDAEDEQMQTSDESTPAACLRQVIQTKIERDQLWKNEVKGKREDVAVESSQEVELDSNQGD